MRRAHRNPRAHRKPDLARWAARGRRSYRRQLRRAGMPLDKDWVRVVTRWSVQMSAEDAEFGRWTVTRWMPTPDGGWSVETATSE